uniref:Uncharacterized protein n=1 Tax=Leersia perrieri TaxID=77586 RepID=A0A0D9UWW6_9ORYZ
MLSSFPLHRRSHRRVLDPFLRRPGFEAAAGDLNRRVVSSSPLLAATPDLEFWTLRREHRSHSRRAWRDAWPDESPSSAGARRGLGLDRAVRRAAAGAARVGSRLEMASRGCPPRDGLGGAARPPRLDSPCFVVAKWAVEVREQIDEDILLGNARDGNGRAQSPPRHGLMARGLRGRAAWSYSYWIGR